MTKASDNAFPSLLITEGTEPSAPAAGKQRLYIDSTTHKLKRTDSSGTDVTIEGTAGTTITGNQLFAVPPGYTGVATGTSALVASAAYMGPIVVSAPMFVRNLAVLVSTAGSGTHQWGLFDYSASATAATKLAGGSGALNSTGELTIAATGAPVSIQPGAYMLIVHAPSSNAATTRIVTTTVASKMNQQAQTSYVWDDTPDLTSGWGGAAATLRMWYLTGDIVSGTTF